MKFYAIASLLGSLATFTSASHFVAYAGEYYSGANTDLGNCGCSNIPDGYRGSFKWYATGQSARAYDMFDCKGSAYTTLASDSSWDRDTSFGFHSIFINC
jgi:hypothetical protein